MSKIKRDFSRESPALLNTLGGNLRPIGFDGNNQPYTIEYMIREGIKKGIIPNYLYKYRAPDHKNSVAPDRFTENIFNEQSLWFGGPGGFNDPFDCRLVVQSNNTYEEILNYLLLKTPELLLEKDAYTRLKMRDDVVLLAHDMYRDKNKWHDFINNYIQNQLNTSGICSFSTKYDNPLMWAHYSNSHTGLCLKYDVSIDPYFFSMPAKIHYSETYPIYNLASSAIPIILRQEIDQDYGRFMLTKSIDWEYEDEWRVTKDAAEVGAFPFKKEALIEVLFGCKACDKFINKIRSLAIESGFTHLIYKKARISKTHFRLEFDDLF